MDRSDVVLAFELFAHGSEGIGAWITRDANPFVLDRLARIETDPVSKVQLNQLLVLGREAIVSDDFFNYYWIDVPDSHPYPVKLLPDYSDSFNGKSALSSLAQLKWGLYRLYYDGLLYFGNIRSAFRQLRSMTAAELRGYFGAKRVDTQNIRDRGPPLPLRAIARDDSLFNI
jgi:hypothetical protein